MKQYNTPHRSRVVKTRLTDEEYADFAQRLSAYGISQSEFLRQEITNAVIRPIITVFPINDELLSTVGKLTAEYGKAGCKHCRTAAAMNYLKAEVMEMCHKENLYQIDLLHGSK